MRPLVTRRVLVVRFLTRLKPPYDARQIWSRIQTGDDATRHLTRLEDPKQEHE